MSAAVHLPKERLYVIATFLVLAFLALYGFTAKVQILEGELNAARSDDRVNRTVEMPAYRGRILDRHGKALAVSRPVHPLYVKVGKAQAWSEEEWQSLAQSLSSNVVVLKETLAGADKNGMVAIKRDATPEMADAITRKRKEIMADRRRKNKEYWQGLVVDKAYKRFYMEGEVMAPLLGVVNGEGVGVEGLELAQESWLAGSDGARNVKVVPGGSVVEEEGVSLAARNGGDVQLSIDSYIQNIAYRELKAAVQTHKARAGSMVVLDAVNGEVLAMANYPSFDPNAISKVDREHMRNRAIMDVFEPGSTIKPFTIGMALDTKKTTLEQVQATGSPYVVGSFTVKDAHPHADLTTAQVLQKSSNIGTARIAEDISKELMWRTLNDVGFGLSPNVGFPHERAGRLRLPSTWARSDKVTLSYGYGLSVNLLQLARSYTVFTNSGALLTASLLKTDLMRGGGSPIFTAKTAQDLSLVLEKAATKDGTAPLAQTDGYRVAGKTGTAKKNQKGQYQAGKYVSSFVGFAPVSSPRLIVAVMID
ncbi:MAG: penicillin-binding protein, partial [Pseudomonadota bacterium]